MDRDINQDDAPRECGDRGVVGGIEVRDQRRREEEIKDQRRDEEREPIEHAPHRQGVIPIGLVALQRLVDGRSQDKARECEARGGAKQHQSERAFTAEKIGEE